MYKLFYNPAVRVEMLVPCQSLEQCLMHANLGDISCRIKLVRLNWMVKHVAEHGIQKPILVDSHFNILTGDTRKMALDLNPSITHVPVVMTGKVSPDDWITVRDKKHLADLLKTCTKDIIVNYNDWYSKPLDWLEIAYPHTEDHMHVVSDRERMINNYLARHPDTIFDQDWLSETIDWSLYDH